MGATKKEVIEMKPLAVRYMEVTIIGDGDLVLNKMNDVTAKELTDKRKDKAKDTAKPNAWESIITAIHWKNGKPTDFTEDGLKEALNPKNNAPCVTGFGLKKSFGDAVVRNEIDKYKTKFDASVNVVGDLVPITFTEHYVDEKLMSPKKGSPVLVNLNRFTGWSATFTVSYMENVYSAEQIMNIINLAGFGLGIGSGRSSGYGRYHVSEVKAV